MEYFTINKKRYGDLMKLDRTNAVNLLVYLLFNADEKGVLIVSIRTISLELNIGLWKVRDLLKSMYSAQILTHKLTHQGSEITICDIGSYKENFSDFRTQNRTQNRTPKKTIEERKKEFTEKLRPYLEKYGKDTLNNFYQYWTQINESGTKMLWEMQKAFQIPNRLATWHSKEQQKQNNMDIGVNLKDSTRKNYTEGVW